MELCFKTAADERVQFPSSKGYFFERSIVDKTMLQLGLQITSDGHTTARAKGAYQRRARDAATDLRNVLMQDHLDSQARRRIKELYPRIPEWDQESIISRGFDLVCPL
jgi:hypothetical protein